MPKQQKSKKALNLYQKLKIKNNKIKKDKNSERASETKIKKFNIQIPKLDIPSLLKSNPSRKSNCKCTG